MIETNKLISVLLLATIVGFGVDRYSGTHQLAKSDVKENVIDNKDVHTVTRVCVDKRPNGETKTLTTTDTVTIDKEKTSTDTSVTPVSKDLLTVSAIIAFSPGSVGPVYGISAAKQVLGPFSAGAFLLTDGTIGASIGVSF